MQGSQSREPSVGSARELLGVAADADAAELGRAYRRRAGRIHPDVSLEPDATEQFRILRAAYQVALSAARTHTSIAESPLPVEHHGPVVVPGARCTGGPAVFGPWPRRGRVAWLAAGPVQVEPSPQSSSRTGATTPEGDRP